MSEILLARQKRKDFLHRIVTGNKKWIYFDNPKQRKSINIDTEAEYSRQKSNAIYMVGPEECSVS